MYNCNKFLDLTNAPKLQTYEGQRERVRTVEKGKERKKERESKGKGRGK